MEGNYTHWQEGQPITRNADQIKIAGHIGKWYCIDETTWRNKQVFLLEHETYGDEAAHLIVDSNGSIIHDEVYDGFDNLDDIE